MGGKDIEEKEGKGTLWKTGNVLTPQILHTLLSHLLGREQALDCACHRCTKRLAMLLFSVSFQLPKTWYLGMSVMTEVWHPTLAIISLKYAATFESSTQILVFLVQPTVLLNSALIQKSQAVEKNI